VAAGAEQVASYRRVPKSRGYLKLTGFRVATRYPFGIIEKWRVLAAEDEMLVYPALAPEPEARSDLRSMGTEAPTPRVGPGTEVAGLRGYQSGDEARAIHWRRTAALGRLVVLEKQRDQCSHLCILLDNARPAALVGESAAAWEVGFELAISRAAAVAVAAVQRDLSVDVVCRGTRSSVVMAGTPADPVLRFLALLDSVPEADADPLPAVQRGVRLLRIAVMPLRRAA
jgi:uncharacterized protein (DUF58 family)